MHTLLLGPHSEKLIPTIIKTGHTFTRFDDRIDQPLVLKFKPDFIISFGYRHIIKQDIIALHDNRIINLHISHLPWNKGADPNLWSHLEQTPSGVTIHHIDSGIDTGDIIAQKEVNFALNTDTLATSYEKLQKSIITLFGTTWKDIYTEKAQRTPQPHLGTCHFLKDKLQYMYLLEAKGWDTPLINIWGRGLSGPKERS